MANRKNNLSSLLNQLSSVKVDGQSVSKLLSPSSTVTATQAGTEKSAKPPTAGDTKTLSFSAKTVATGINFGSPSSTRTSTSQSGSEWTSLLTQTASGGPASALGGLGSIAGLGGIIAGIASLFGGGGKSTPPPLVQFQLPASQTQTVYVSSNTPTTGGSTYTSSPTPQASNSSSNGQAFQYQSTQIAQAVKTALLNSNTLGDVIAEI